MPAQKLEAIPGQALERAPHVRVQLEVVGSVAAIPLGRVGKVVVTSHHQNATRSCNCHLCSLPLARPRQDTRLFGLGQGRPAQPPNHSRRQALRVVLQAVRPLTMNAASQT